MTTWDPLDIDWCLPCRNGRHYDCRPIPFCTCPVELEHDMESDDD